MKEETAPVRAFIQRYLLLGITFLLWENLVGSVVGVYNMEIRRTLWGIVIYGLGFLFFGGLAETLSVIHSRLFPQWTWPRQRTIWLLAVLYMFLWGDLSRLLLSDLLGLQSLKQSYLFNTAFWIPLALLAGFIINVALARRARSHGQNDFVHGWLYPAAALIYLVISTKVTYRYFQFDALTTANVMLQPAFISLSLVLSWLLTWATSSLASIQKRSILAFAVGTTSIVFISGNQTITSATSTSGREDPRPNVVILLFDALRNDHVGRMEGSSTLTPQMDELARQGTRYPSCYAPSAWTFASVTGLMTSRVPNELGLVEKGYLPERVTTLAEVLQRYGYHTAALSANDLVTCRNGFGQGFDDFRFLRGQGPRQLLLPCKSFFPTFRVLEELAYQTDFLATEYLTADWREMNDHAAQILEESHKPLFLYMHYIEPHSPYWAAPFRDGLLDLQQLTASLILSWPSFKRFSFAQNFIQENREEVSQKMIGRYRDGVRTADGAVAEMRSHLRRLGMEDNTVIVITADHGEELMERGRLGHKSSLFEEQVKVPLIVYLPPELGWELPPRAAGVSSLDLAPTVLDLAGIPEEIPQAAGLSLLEPEPVSGRSKFTMVDVGESFLASLVQEPYKLIIRQQHKTGRKDTMLFHLGNDPHERINLYPEARAVAESIAPLLQQQVRLTVTPSENINTPSVLDIQRLRSLGYSN